MTAPFSNPPTELQIDPTPYLKLCPQGLNVTQGEANSAPSNNPERHLQQGQVSDVEVDRMISMYPLSPPPSAEFLEKHYGLLEAQLILKTFSSANDNNLSQFLGCLNYFGIASRWREFYSWLTTSSNLVRSGGARTEDHDAENACTSTTTTGSKVPDEQLLLRTAFKGFANHLGRVTTYRALALDDTAVGNIFKADEIFPTGQLHTTADKLSDIIANHGVRKVVVARLYISHLKRLIGYDPSISLHDDWETTSCIASGYCGQGGKKVYLFQLSVPVVESLGFRLLDVAGMAEPFLGPKYSNHAPWFCFPSPSIKSGVWFDATVQRTERYGLHTMPFLQQRLKKLFCFPTVESITQAIRPFADQQAELNKRFPHGEGCPHPVETWPDEKIPQ